MIVKKHTNPQGQIILAVCDDNLIGKKFEEGKKQLDLSNPFYDGDKKDEAEVLLMVEQAYIINAAGKVIIDLLKKEGYIQDEHVLHIDNIPHAQVCVIRE